MGVKNIGIFKDQQQIAAILAAAGGQLDQQVSASEIKSLRVTQYDDGSIKIGDLGGRKLATQTIDNPSDNFTRTFEAANQARSAGIRGMGDSRSVEEARADAAQANAVFNAKYGNNGQTAVPAAPPPSPKAEATANPQAAPPPSALRARPDNLGPKEAAVTAPAASDNNVRFSRPPELDELSEPQQFVDAYGKNTLSGHTGHDDIADQSMAKMPLAEARATVMPGRNPFNTPHEPVRAAPVEPVIEQRLPTTPPQAPAAPPPQAAPVQPEQQGFEFSKQGPGTYQHNPVVADAQRMMNELKDEMSGLDFDLATRKNPQGDDGLFGPKTEDAVKQTQEALGMEVTGQITPEFMEKLEAKVAELKNNVTNDATLDTQRSAMSASPMSATDASFVTSGSRTSFAAETLGKDDGIQAEALSETFRECSDPSCAAAAAAKLQAEQQATMEADSVAPPTQFKDQPGFAYT